MLVHNFLLSFWDNSWASDMELLTIKKRNAGHFKYSYSCFYICGAYGLRRGECIGSWWGNRREGDHWGDLGVDGWIILGWISRRWNVCIYPHPTSWIGLAQDRDRWRTLVSAVMNLRVAWNAGNFLTSCKPVSCSGRTLYHGVSVYIYIYIYICTTVLSILQCCIFFRFFL